MKFLLVNPPIPHSFYNREYYLPSALLYLGSVLKENKNEVEVLDFKTFQGENRPDPKKEIYDSKLLERIKMFKPDIVGFGGLFSGNFLDVERLSKVAKKNFNLETIFGGAHPSMYAYDILRNCQSLDYLFLGEAEDSIIDFVKAKKGNTGFDKIDGFAYRKDKEIKINPKTKYPENLDQIPFPAYDLVKLEDYYQDTSNWHNPKKLEINTSIPIISSRSCPHDCNFCAAMQITGRGWRPRSAKNVVDEIEMIYHKYKQPHFAFMDDNLTLSKSRFLEICNQINRRNLNIQFETHNGVSINSLDDELIDAMAQTGLTRIALPIESGSDYIRNKVMGKKLSKEKILRVVNRLKKHKDVYLRAFFIIGMPEETHETLMDTYNLIEEINVDKVHLTNIIPFPGSRLFDQAMRDNLLINIDKENLYRSDALYQTNYDTYFIKPYNLELEELRNFRRECEGMIAKQKNKKD